jgi:hypothetical protein
VTGGETARRIRARAGSQEDERLFALVTGGVAAYDSPLRGGGRNAGGLSELSAHRPELLDGVGLIVGIDRFMSEARALTNFAGNAVATVLVATWTQQLDREQLSAALSGQAPFDEATMLDDEHGPVAGTNAGPGTGMPTRGSGTWPRGLCANRRRLPGRRRPSASPARCAAGW